MEYLNIIGVLLLIAGFVLAGIEMILPGFSVPGVSAIICLVAGVFVLADTVTEAVFITIAVLALLGILLAVVLWLFSKGKLRTPLILEEEQKKAEGYLSSSDLQYLLGKRGVSVTDLRPSGIGKFEDVNFDVMSEGYYISRGTAIEIIKVEGSKLVVRAKGKGGEKNG